MFQEQPPCSEEELVERSLRLEGLSVAQLAARLSTRIPQHPIQRKGWIGLLVERALGTTAGSLSAPDFMNLGIELKTLPMKAPFRSAESTFVSSIPLLRLHEQTWETSTCYAKLKRVLWIPIESSSTIDFPYRRFGRSLLWSPSEEQHRVLADDWVFLSTVITTGGLAEVDARWGEYLQVRPKAANSRASCAVLDEDGCSTRTLPRGFYLRARFTSMLFSSHAC